MAVNKTAGFSSATAGRRFKLSTLNMHKNLLPVVVALHWSRARYEVKFY